MAEKNNIEKPSKIQDPPPLQPTSSTYTSTEKTKIEEEDPETIRGSKRRKNCPTALDKIEEFTPSNPYFSFTFDTQFTGTTAAEITPKFGSFNPVIVSTQEKENNQCFQSLKDKEAAQDGGEDKLIGDDEEREGLNVGTLRHIDVIKEIG